MPSGPRSSWALLLGIAKDASLAPRGIRCPNPPSETQVSLGSVAGHCQAGKALGLRR